MVFLPGVCWYDLIYINIVLLKSISSATINANKIIIRLDVVNKALTMGDDSFELY